MHRSRALLFSLLPLSLYALGCGEDVGQCDDPAKGQDTVVVDGVVQYGGQAIMNRSCANGCHSSKAEGKGRNGAPAGLDFDLAPEVVDANAELGTNVDGEVVVRLPIDKVTGLRNRQRRVFEQRNLIWEQVREGLMPPGGMFAGFRRLASIWDSDEKSPCAQKYKIPYEDIDEKSSHDVLRNWLACGAPIVESNGPMVKTIEAKGAAGFQFQSCEAPPLPSDGDGGVTTITIKTVHERVLASCATCHSEGGIAEPDLSTPEVAYDAIVGKNSTGAGCEDKVLITPGDVSKSYFFEKVNAEKPSCGSQMPLGMALPPAQQALIRQWIEGGALKQ